MLAGEGNDAISIVIAGIRVRRGMSANAVKWITDAANALPESFRCCRIETARKSFLSLSLSLSRETEGKISYPFYSRSKKLYLCRTTYVSDFRGREVN